MQIASHATPTQLKRLGIALACLAVFVAAALVAVGALTSAFPRAGQGGLQNPAAPGDAGSQVGVEAADPFYVLLIGSDSRKGTALYTGRSADHAQTDQHSDIMTLVRVDALNNKITLVTIPRDTPMPGGSGKINDALLHNNPAEVVSAVETLTGVQVSGYIMANFTNFPTLIDNLGGVTVDVPADITVDNPATGKNITVKAGKNKTLNGQETLALARGRKMYETDQDAYRQVNVRNIERALIEKVVAMEDADAALAAINYLRDDCTSNLDYATLAPLMLSVVESDVPLTFYSCTGPYAGEMDSEAGQWVCYEDAETWAALMAVVDAGEDPTGIVEVPQF